MGCAPSSTGGMGAAMDPRLEFRRLADEEAAESREAAGAG